MMGRKNYDTDLSDEQWELIEPLVRFDADGPGRDNSTARDQNAIRYLVRTGCHWRLLPHDFPNWHTVRDYYDQWRHDGTWRCMNELLIKLLRIKNEREESPSVLIVDSQSVKTTEMGGDVGIDGGKKSRGKNADRGGFSGEFA